MERSTWTEEDIRKLVEEEGHAYQKMELADGVATRGRDRGWACDRIFGVDLTGKTVLDVGSAQGYFSFAALARGARRAVGWEIDPDRLRQATAIARSRGSEAEFCQGDIEVQTPGESFDVVLCLNVLHHLTDPIATLDKLIGLTRETLVLEVASLGARDRRWSGLRAWQSWALRSAPVIVVGNRKQTYFFTRKAMANFFHHRPDFARVEIFDSDHKDRFFVKAHRHRVRRVVVVAGPAGAGKSALNRRLLSARLPQLTHRLKIADVSQWREVKAKAIRKGSDVLPDTFILHYDFLRPDKTWPKSYDRDPALRLLDWAEEVAVVTLWTLPQRLRDQFYRANVGAHVVPGEAGHPMDDAVWMNAPALLKWARRVMKRLVTRIRRESEKAGDDPEKRLAEYKHVLQIYEQPERVVGLYRRWFHFCETRAARWPKQMIVQLDEGLAFLSREEWEIAVREYERRSA